ncbi:hypothetical protein V7S43_018700 [Phytophthora oleae]|uniref:Uncharacterized protein n=1 Tax=Phytophthora oleae TaxID=2107226 RepID=A0ABD3EQK0_9STRA
MPESQGRFEGGATSLVTCHHLSGSLGLAIEKEDFENPSGYEARIKAEVSPPSYETRFLIEQEAATLAAEQLDDAKILQFCIVRGRRFARRKKLCLK